MWKSRGDKLKMKLISVPFISYSKRILDLSLSCGTFMLLIIIPISFFYVSVYTGILLILFAVYYFNKILQEARLYIVEINVLNDELELQYYWLNKGPIQIKVPIKSITVEWFDSVKGNISAPRILIKGKDFKISQYSVGKWEKDTLKYIFEKLNLLKR